MGWREVWISLAETRCKKSEGDLFLTREFAGLLSDGCTLS